MSEAMAADGDRAIEMIRQLAVSRRFDAKQAVEIVQAIGELSPFDKVRGRVCAPLRRRRKNGELKRGVLRIGLNGLLAFSSPSPPRLRPLLSFFSSLVQVEAAVRMYPALMSPASLRLVLEQFADREEQENVCHRLGLRLADVMG